MSTDVCIDFGCKCLQAAERRAFLVICLHRVFANGMGNAETEESEWVRLGKRHCHFKTICSLLNAAAAVVGLLAIWPGQGFGYIMLDCYLAQGLWNLLG